MLQEEISAGSAYAALLSALRTRAEAARERGDVAAVARLLDELERRDAQLGRRRPAEVAALRRDLESTIDAVKAFQAALASHKRQLAAARTYERRLAPLFDRFDSLEEHLTTLKEMGGITPGQISLAEAELLRIAQELDGIRPPESLAGVHTAFGNVVRLAQEAFARRRQARSSRSNEMREASAAAAGAMLLIEQVRADLAASLEPPVLP
jgi:chromosome segregation ATPase